MHLVPCPFCGSKNPLFNIAQARPGDKPGWYVRCRSSKCAARIEAGTAPAAMKRWNSRPGEVSSVQVPSVKQDPAACPSLETENLKLETPIP